MLLRVMQYSFACFLSCVCCLSGAHADGLTFDEALSVLRQQDPTLLAQNAGVSAAQSAEKAAGQLPDPKAFLGVGNLPMSGNGAYTLSGDPMAMQVFGISQDVPNARKRAAWSKEAAVDVDVAQHKRRSVLSQLLRDTALAWVNRYYTEQRLALLDEIDVENRALLSMVRAEVASGKKQPIDTVASEQAMAEWADERDDLLRARDEAKAALIKLLGNKGNEDLAGTPPALAVDVNTLRQQVSQYPDVRLYRALVRKDEALTEEAQANKHPDWGWSLAYERRAPGLSDMVSVQVTVGLPIFAATRQDPEIAARQAGVSKAEADQLAMLREQRAKFADDLADYTASTHKLARVQQTWLPLAQEKYQLALAGYRAGKSTADMVIQSRQEWITQQFKAIDLENQRDDAAIRLRFANGGEES